jgi:choline-sulfatase
VRRLTPILLLVLACAEREVPVSPPPQERASILLVTLDTTRADAIGDGTPSFRALAARGRRFAHAYATAPQTLPSHSSMLTGLYPGGHGVHENARYLAPHHPLVSEKLKEQGYQTAAFVSAFVLARRYGLARGFDVYDDELEDERSAKMTTDRALAWLAQPRSAPVFLWVHYFDPHFPYAPSYAAEVTAMDAELGRLVAAFERIAGPRAIVVAADHGEGLGDHGEAQHGNLLYQSVMHVPMVVVGPGVNAGSTDVPVSTRRVFHTLLDFAGVSTDLSLRHATKEVVLGEAMVPFLQYGWQPQVMAVEGPRKAILAGSVEAYDVASDPAEKHDLGPGADLSRETRKALREYPVPTHDAPPPAAANDEERRRLASLGYVTADAKPVVRPDAPRPRDMAHLFETLDRASVSFAQGEYAAAIPLLETILRADSHNLMAALRIAAAQSALGRNEAALRAFRQAEAIAPNSPDVRHYLAMHYARVGQWDEAIPLLERVVAESPDRLPALERLAEARERQERLPEALALWRKVHAMRSATPAESIRIGELSMAVGDTASAIQAFERARSAQGAAFRHDLELGVLYLAARRFAEARDALDRVPASHPGYAMALFKRAQVSVLLGEPDSAERVAKARARADESTRALIENEKLFRR